jgi:hypothetical protein
MMELLDLIDGLRSGTLKIVAGYIFLGIEKTEEKFLIKVEVDASGDDLVSSIGQIVVEIKPIIYTSPSGEVETYWGEAIKRVREIVENLLGARFYIVEVSGNVALRFDRRFDE